MKFPKKAGLLISLLIIAMISVLSYERISLLFTYIKLTSDETLEKSLNTVPELKILEKSVDDSETISLGYGEFQNLYGSIESISMELFPKVILILSENKIMFIPPSKYGVDLSQWRESQEEVYGKPYPPPSKLEKEYLNQRDFDPYNVSKNMFSTMPSNLFKVAFLPKSKLRNYVYRLKYKSSSCNPATFFECGKNLRAIHGPLPDNSGSLLRIYEIDDFLSLYIMIICEDENRRLDIAEKILRSYRFTINELPEREELYSLIKKAIENGPIKPVTWPKEESVQESTPVQNFGEGPRMK